MTHHNTTGETGQTLLNFQSKAQTQDSIVLEYFRLMGFMGNFTASRIHADLIMNWIISGSTPITSIRRAMSKLAKAGKLIKTDDKRMGPMGRNEHIYKLKA